MKDRLSLPRLITAGFIAGNLLALAGSVPATAQTGCVTRPVETYVKETGLFGETRFAVKEAFMTLCTNKDGRTRDVNIEFKK